MKVLQACPAGGIAGGTILTIEDFTQDLEVIGNLSVSMHRPPNLCVYVMQLGENHS